MPDQSPLGGYYKGIENLSGVCGQIFQGDLMLGTVNAIVPGIYTDPVCVLTVSGEEMKKMIETGFAIEEKNTGNATVFTYIPAGIVVAQNADGTVKKITLPDGSAFDELSFYTVAIDKGGFTDEIGEAGDVQITGFRTVDVVREYFSAHSPLSPLKHSIQ